MKTSDKTNDNRAVVIAAMVCVTILVYGLMQMWIANGQRHELHTWTDKADNSVVQVFDKRTGKCYTFSGMVFDYVNAETSRRKWEHAVR